jgi:hypothetical protein
MFGIVCYQFATLGAVEATVADDDEKNHLCPPIRYWDDNADYLSAFLASLVRERARAAYPAVANWAKTTRLNPMSGMALVRDDPAVIESRERIKSYAGRAAANIQRLLGQ